MSKGYVEGKPLRLSQLIEILSENLRVGGDCDVTAGCWSEGIDGPPSITRGPAGVYFDFYGAETGADEAVLWGVQ